MNFFYSILRFLPIVIIFGLTIGIYYLMNLNLPAHSEKINTKEIIPICIMEDMIITEIKLFSDIKYKIAGQKFIYYANNTSKIYYPTARFFRRDKPSITIKADSGYINEDMTTLELIGNAIFTQNNSTVSTENNSLSMSSEKFKIDFYKEIISSDQPILVKRRSSILRSEKGATFDNILQTLTMTGSVKGLLDIKE